MLIRRISEQDTGKLLTLLEQLDQEMECMYDEAGQRRNAVEQEQERLKNLLNTEYDMLFIAEAKGQLVGFLAVNGNKKQRQQHCVKVEIGVLRLSTEHDIGIKLFDELEYWANEKKIHRLELTVNETNRSAMLLFDKVGFKIEGMRKQSLFIDDEFVNEFYMAKLL